MKKYMTITIIIVLSLLLSIGFITYIRVRYSKENAYVGHVDVWFYNNTSIERICEISHMENLTIITIENYTVNGELLSIKVEYYAPISKDGEKVKEKLLKYEEIESIALYIPK